MTASKGYSLSEIAAKIGATVHGDGDCIVSSIATLANASQGQISFLANVKYQQQLGDCQASAVILSADCLDACKSHALVMDNPYLGYAKVAQLLDTTPACASKIHASAVIAADVELGENVTIGANAIIESGVRLADDVSIGAGCFIGQNARIGTGTRLWANVTIYHNVIMGTDCLVQANTVIGSDGFGYAKDQGQWIKIPQLGTVIIGNRVEIGASTTIDRGALDNTIIHDGVILDNQLQIAHNVVVGENTAIAACSVIAGSTVIGKNCTIAGLVGINGHIEVCDNCVLTGRAMVTKSLTKPGVYSSGMPAQPNKQWNLNNARTKQLDVMAKRIKALEKQLDRQTT